VIVNKDFQNFYYRYNFQHKSSFVVYVVVVVVVVVVVTADSQAYIGAVAESPSVSFRAIGITATVDITSRISHVTTTYLLSAVLSDVV